MFKSKKPNKAAMTHLLNLEFESRRRFITSDLLKEQDRPTKILEAYPCFRELDHVSNVGPIHFQLFQGLILARHNWHNVHILYLRHYRSFLKNVSHPNVWQGLAVNIFFQWISFLYLNIFFRCWMSCSESSNQPIPNTSLRWRADGKPSIQRSSFMGWWKKPWSLLKLWMEVKSQYIDLFILYNNVS